MSAGSGSRREKLPTKVENFFCFAGCSILRAEGFSCSLDVLHGGLRMNNQTKRFFPLVKFYYFGLKTHDPDPELDPDLR